MKNKKINISEKLKKFNDYWSPKVVAEMNDYQFKLAKISGGFIWHHHESTDEVFYVVEGNMIIEFRDGKVELSQGEIYVGPKGVEHKPYAEKECHIMLIEPRGILNTGEVKNEHTAINDNWI